MPFFKHVFKSKDTSRSGSKAEASSEPAPRPRWEDAWSRKDVAPEEIQELVHLCTQEMKSRAVDMPFILLPFRPTSDSSASRNFVRSFFKAQYEGTRQYRGESLKQELRLSEPLTLCSIIKWCWSRLPGGVVTWDAYELFRIGESDSNFARHAFDTFIPLSVDVEARQRIIFDFFDLLSAVAARGKTNGMGGRKLSRMAGWWAFEFHDDGNGFDGGYRTWEKAADAASHLFFAYLRSLSPDANALGGISLPRSLQALLSQTEYPPQAPALMQSRTTKVVMIVDSVSPTPFALLRRAKNFEYRDEDAALQQFSAYDDTVKALTEECRRVLDSIASANQSVTSPAATTPDPTWSRFEDFGFAELLDNSASGTNGAPAAGGTHEFSGLRNGARSKETDFGRPTTPSWADFLSSGFADENSQASPTTLLLPSQKLPPLGEPARVHSSQSHVRNINGSEEDLEPGELASITAFDLDETFWWVWMTSLANEETPDRKAAFGRCTIIETRIPGGKWLIMEEQIKGAAAGLEEGAYIAEKKSKFSFTKRGRLGRRKSTGKKTAPAAKDPYNRTNTNTPSSTIGVDQHARIQAAAAKLAQKEREQKAAEQRGQRRARMDDTTSVKTNSVLTLQPHLLSEAGPAMKWDKRFGEGAKDKDALRAQYLGDIHAGKGTDLKSTANGRSSPLPPEISNRDLPALPKSQTNLPASRSQVWENPASNASQDVTITPVPWPEDSPLPTPRLESDDKALAPPPVLKTSVPDHRAITPAPTNVRRSEEQTKQLEPKKLEKKKKEGGGGFRKLFGRKKTDISAPAAVNQPRPSEDDSQLRALDAARSTSRISHHNQQYRESSPDVSIKQAEPVRTYSPALEHNHYPMEQDQHMMEPPSPPLAPGSAALEQREADRAFSRFDQGPMEDMPAFVPEDSDDEDSAAPPAIHRRPMGQESRIPRPVTPPQQQAAYGRDDMSEDSVDVGRQASPTQDRWAQIRKNAADRAARLSEEQTRRSRSQSQSQRTDEGETSGEETIESRVARIKARVAELTGNVDGVPGRPGGAMR
ncbi:hypothetical protein C7974DRAFT_391335 [Boeremia exigua]|uniref:uncharacterized protein n=1 Tax=Boeremia exigua TaxID=749465 RepID=UPI001E8DEEA2|nr:uncharacterized protein C7974DRAFT_391335 [Boeremia exigua]KAH6638325.1 hypothetical protein C7974DRAFT_391335 [Boeremia exigua]